MCVCEGVLASSEKQRLARRKGQSLELMSASEKIGAA